MAEEQKTLGQLTGDEFVTKAYQLFDEYISAFESEKNRLKTNENYYQAKHWENMGSNTDDPQPITPIIHSTVENMKADLMDNFPEAIIQPEAPEDQLVAEIVGGLIRQNHDASSYRREYAKLAHDVLVGGWCVQEVGYDPQLNKGLGGAFIRYVNNENFMCDPQVVDIQEGRAVFMYAPKTKEWLEARYPEFAGEFASDSYTLETDNELTYDDTKNLLFIECWFKEWIEEGEEGHWAVHMCQMAGKKLLADSRDEKPEGYFSMGEYPFIVTPLYRRKNSALGYGIPDMFGTMQEYSDKLDQITMKNAAMASHNKLLNTRASGFDTDDLRDWSKEVHEGEMLNGVTWFANPPLPNYIIGLSEQIRQNVKDESGANDFSRGNTAGGVTAASAIATLVELSSKRSRMVALLLHEAFKEAVRYEIEFEREFNVLPRDVVLVVDGQQQTATFESAIMDRQSALGNDVPIEFMVSIKVEKENRWQIASHNELMLQMTQLGILQPQQALELMQFEGKESVLNKGMQQQQMSMEQMQQQQEMQQAEAEQADIDQQIAALQGQSTAQPIGDMNSVDAQALNQLS